MSFLNSKNNATTKDDENERKCQECMSHLTSILMTMTSKPKILFEAMGVQTSHIGLDSAARDASDAAKTDLNVNQSHKSIPDSRSANNTKSSLTNSNNIFWTMDDDGKGLRLQIPRTKSSSLLLNKNNNNLKQGNNIHNETVSGFGGAAAMKRDAPNKESVNVNVKEDDNGTTSPVISSNEVDENDTLLKHQPKQQQQVLLPSQNGNKGILQRMKTKLTKTFQSKQLVATSSINNDTNTKNDNNHITLEIQCQECGTNGPEGSARAFLRGPSPLTIVLCTNRLSLSNNKEIDEVLTHELIHVFDVHHRKWDFTNCQTLARSEIRAAREAECDSVSSILASPFGRTMSTLFGKDRCVMEKAKEATKNMFPYNGFDCVNNVFKEAMMDSAPFGNDGINGRRKGKEENSNRSTIATSWLHEYSDHNTMRNSYDNSKNNRNDVKRTNNHGADGFIGGRAFTSSFSS